ncbi:MAG TPA: hypothetical protein VFG47_14055, partial [Geminicoccaceae bacterium]|nr:hypothetical protein [Geminicoccaceae bacterium]
PPLDRRWAVEQPPIGRTGQVSASGLRRGRLGRLWAGEVPLHRAFWDYAVIGGLAVNLTTSLLFLMLISADRPIAALIVGYACSVPYNVLVLVAVWRSAGRYEGDRRWADLARIVIVIWVVVASLT